MVNGFDQMSLPFDRLSDPPLCFAEFPSEGEDGSMNRDGWIDLTDYAVTSYSQVGSGGCVVSTRYA
jgi:hypothetical protein